jgi:hypothetical protein
MIVCQYDGIPMIWNSFFAGTGVLHAAKDRVMTEKPGQENCENRNRENSGKSQYPPHFRYLIISIPSRHGQRANSTIKKATNPNHYN